MHTKQKSLLSLGLDPLVSVSNNLISYYSKKLKARRHIIKSIKAKTDAKRSLAEKFADFLTSSFGSMAFLILNLFWFAIWIPINLDLIPGVEPFDPFPFGLMTMIVSLEAIILAIVVLISQNRASKVNDLREETDLQINLIAEEEITKLMHLLILSLKKQGIDVQKDKELQKMLQPISPKEIEKRLESEID